MIDRHGMPVRVAFAEHELIWISAALRLDRHEHTAAFLDIASMTGRSLQSVQFKAYAMQKARLEASRTRKVMVPSRHMQRPKYSPPPLAPSQLKPITTEQRMTGRA